MALVWCLPAYVYDIQRHAHAAHVARIEPSEPFAANDVQHVNHARHKIDSIEERFALYHLGLDIGHVIHALPGVAVFARAAFDLGKPAAHVAQPRAAADAIARHFRDI